MVNLVKKNKGWITSFLLFSELTRIFHKSFWGGITSLTPSVFMANICMISLLPTLNGSVDEKNHTDSRLMCCFYACRTQLSISLSGITRMYSELRKIRRFSAMAAVALDTGFPSHGAAMISLGIGWAVAVWSDLCTGSHALPVWRVWAWPYLAEHWKALCAEGSRFSRCGAIHRLHRKNRDVNGWPGNCGRKCGLKPGHFWSA